MKDKADTAKNRTLQAVALQYQDLAELPRVTASGLGAVAQQIIDIARANQIPIQSEGELAQLLLQSPAGSKMPTKTLELIAEVLAYLYYVDQQWRTEHSFLASVLEAPDQLKTD